MGLGSLEKIRHTMKEMLPELNKLSHEHLKEKWQLSVSQKPRFTEQDIEGLQEKSWTSRINLTS
jgi:hypothetical protein